MRPRRFGGAAAALIALCLAAPLAPTTSATGSVRPSAPVAESPEAVAEPGSPHDAAAERVESMSVREQAASVVMGHIPSTDPTALAAYMRQGLGGFILMGANIPATEAELMTLTAALATDPALPPLIAIDQEGGIVSRLPADGYPSSETLKSRPAAESGAAFSARASLVARAGISVNFGTVADVTADSSSFIYGRALGVDPVAAAERVAAATAAQEPFVASTLKHFPGHGAAPGDSHHAIPTTEETTAEWRETDARPFEAGIDAGASLLMFGHLAYTSVDPAPASLSPRWHDIARDELGFDGVIVTDDLGMLQSSGVAAYADPVTNAVSALVAGSDLVLMIAGSTEETAGQLVDGITQAVDAGTLDAARLADAATRVLELRLRLSADAATWTLCPECDPAE